MKKKNHKKRIIIVSIVSVIVIVLGFFIYKAKVNHSKANVKKVSEISLGMNDAGGELEAQITDDNAEIFMASNDKTIEKVYVKPGDTVTPGTVLFSYSVTDLKNELSAKTELKTASEARLETYTKLLEYYKSLPIVKEEQSNNDDEDEFDPDQSFDESKDNLPKGVTESEKKDLIKEATSNINELKSTLNTMKVELESLNQKIQDCNVISLVNGVVKTVGDPSKVSNDGTPFLTIGSSSGMVVKTYVDEYKKESLKVGDTLTVMNYMSGGSTTAKVSMISDYPATDYQNYDTKKNASYYEVRATLEDSSDFKVDDYASASILDTSASSQDIICLEKMYVRTDKKGTYCLIRGKDKRLKRVNVKTKVSSTDSSQVIVLSGLKKSDYIAFPYGKKGKVGNRTTTKESISPFSFFFY